MGGAGRASSRQVPSLVYRLLHVTVSCVFLLYILSTPPESLVVVPSEPWYGGSRPDAPVIVTTQVSSSEQLSVYGTLHHRDTIICATWNVNVDAWWSNLPDWEIVLENATHQCFGPMRDLPKAEFLKQLHYIQHDQKNCQQNEATYKKMSGSGWGVDMAHVIDGLRYAVEVQWAVHVVSPTDWQYAVGKKPVLQKPVCSSDEYMDCYFLPLTSCERDKSLVAWTRQQGQISFRFPWRGYDQPLSNQWILHYATRPQTWLRKQAFEIAQTTGFLSTTSACLAIHVRRNDVVLHGKFSRRYHRISEYLDAAWEQGWRFDNILLLTDDANAIAEATSLHPEYRWFYIERARHKANEGGWEHHIPSNDPALEVAVLHATFILLKQCSALVHSKSNLADYFYAVMKQANEQVRRIDIDQHRRHSQIHNEKNIKSTKLSRNVW